MKIRSYEPADESAVVSLWERVFGYAEDRNDPASVIRNKLAVDAALLLVAIESGRLVGTIMAGYDGHRGWLYRAAIRPEAQRRGLGRALVQEAELRLRARGCLKINLQVHSGNRDASVFWRALGYEIEERVSMGKDLTQSAANQG